MSKKKLVCITGPTAVGKSELSLRLAKDFKATIINADASQIRQKLNIGTAKLDYKNIDIPHYLFDIVDVNEEFSIKNYQSLVRPLINDLDRVFLVGGSGLYIKAALYDYDLSMPAREIDNYPALSNQELYAYLETLDSALAHKTHPNNRRRVLRYLEIVKHGQQQSAAVPLYDSLILNLIIPRKDLYENINIRTKQMLENGWILEAQALIKQGYNLDEISQIGYKEINLFLQDKISYDNLISLIQQKTRHYAKRQITWFRHQLETIDINLCSSSYDEIKEIINNFYNE